MENTACAYMAGMIDGEGCIAISRRMARGGVSWSYRLTIIIANNHLPMLESLQREWGGALHKKKGTNCFQLCFAAKDSLTILTECLPYLRIKVNQALIAIKFQASLEKRYGRGVVLSPAVLLEREKLFDELKASRFSDGRNVFPGIQPGNVVDGLGLVN